MLESFHDYFYIETVIWLFAIIFMFHVLEEIITIDHFMATYKNRVPKASLAKLTLVIKKKLGAKSTQLAISFVWILLILSFVILMTAYRLPSGGNFLLFMAALNVFFLQAFSHIGQSLMFRGYTPGVITAIFIVIPYCFLTYFRLFEWGFIDSTILFKSIPITILLVPIFLIGNLLGRRFIR